MSIKDNDRETIKRQFEELGSQFPEIMQTIDTMELSKDQVPILGGYIAEFQDLINSYINIGIETVGHAAELIQFQTHLKYVSNYLMYTLLGALPHQTALLLQQSMEAQGVLELKLLKALREEHIETLEETRARAEKETAFAVSDYVMEATTLFQLLSESQKEMIVTSMYNPFSES